MGFPVPLAPSEAGGEGCGLGAEWLPHGGRPFRASVPLAPRGMEPGTVAPTADFATLYATFPTEGKLVYLFGIQDMNERRTLLPYCKNCIAKALRVRGIADQAPRLRFLHQICSTTSIPFPAK
jgi:hypothetical protein